MAVPPASTTVAGLPHIAGAPPVGGAPGVDGLDQTDPAFEVIPTGPEGRQKVAHGVGRGFGSRLYNQPRQGRQKAHPIVGRTSPHPAAVLDHEAHHRHETHPRTTCSRSSPFASSRLRVRPLGDRHTRIAAKMTRSRKEVLFPSEAHLTRLPKVVALRFQKPASDHLDAMEHRLDDWNGDPSARPSSTMQPPSNVNSPGLPPLSPFDLHYTRRCFQRTLRRSSESGFPKSV